MLATEPFVEGLVNRGFTHLCVVPCSFASSLINACIAHPKLEYLPAASEAVACSVATGLKLAGSRPLVVCQSSGLTNMGSCITSLLNPYSIPLAMLVSWRSYRPGESEIQHQHLATALPDLVAAYGLEWTVLDRDSEKAALKQLENAAEQGGIVVLEEDTFSACGLADEHALRLDNLPTRMAYLTELGAGLEDEVVLIGTTGNTAREMHACLPGRRNFYMAGNMGGALSIGLGASLAGDRVLVCGGDAEATMHLGGMTTAGRYRGKLGEGSLCYLLFDNASNKSTGGQRSYQEHVDYIGLARSSNFAVCDQTVTSIEQFRTALASIVATPGPVFVHVKCAYDPLTPRPDATDISESQHAFGKRGHER